MSDNLQNADEMAEYLQIFLNETEEQLEDLVETMLVLENKPDSTEELNEAFRLIHSIKGSAGIMGFDNITVLTHHLENRFERFRSGLDKLDQPMTNLVLRCIDFLREFTNRLRSGQPPNSASELIAELHAREQSETTESQGTEPKPEPGDTAKDEERDSEAQESTSEELSATGSQVVLRIRFEPGLQLVDLKAQLIVSRLSNLGEIQSTHPPMEDLENVPELTQFEVVLDTTHSIEDIRATADVDGVQSVTVEAESSRVSIDNATETFDKDAKPADQESEDTPAPELEESQARQVTVDEEELVESRAADSSKVVANGSPESASPAPLFQNGSEASQENKSAQPMNTVSDASREEAGDVGTASFPAEEKAKTKAAETLRVDIDRLDNLMNLAGELVVNRARFVQVSSQLSPDLRKSSVVNRLRDLGDNLRQTIDSLQHLSDLDGDWLTRIQELESGVELLQEQAEVMENSRRCFGQITEAIDQLTRVSDKLQRGVLETRMVPVGPLFNRFKRVVRDLAVERGKKVNLELRGEKTELDKRMIDELGDPLVHLVRNSIDHGLEPPEVRRQYDKPEVGTIFLEASHSGHNVFMRVQDDGAGINVDKIRAKATERGLLTPGEELSDEEIIDYIWHPGFSTAETITDLSGRGVGMDVVKTRIHALNGTIDVESIPHQGTTFTIRLPLTLAIINSLLVRTRDVIFSIPISDVREIVAINRSEIVSIHGRETFEVRGEFIPLVSIDDVFEWHDVPYDYGNGQFKSEAKDPTSRDSVHVVILQTVGKSIGLRVDELLGGQEIVIKSLSENFVSIRGLSGASILGNGTVCLMLDAAAVIDLAAQATRNPKNRKERHVGSIG